MRSWEIPVGVFLVSASLLLFELTLTKVFSVILWYHFGFLAISLALLGFSLAGVYQTLRPPPAARPGATLARHAVLAGAGVLVSFLFVTHSQFDTFAIVKEKQEAFLLFLVLELLAPFFFFGLCISASISLFREDVGKVYCANLAGSGFGCLAAIVALNHVTGQQAVVLAAALAGVAGLVFALRTSFSSFVAALVLLGACYGLHGKQLTDAVFELVPPRSKPLAEVPAEAIEFSDWSSLSKVDIFDAGRSTIGLWGLQVKDFRADERIPREYRIIPQRKGVLIDAWAITSITEFDGDLRKLAVLEWLPATAVHRLRRNADIVCLGGGGGLDVLSALYFGQKSITAVEINRLIVEQVKTTYDEFSGHIYTAPVVTVPNAYTPENYSPAVAVHVSEGRHFLEQAADQSYDIIQLSGVDTHSTTEAGAFTLSENYLYTLEAFDTYLRKLRPDGILTLTRWYFVSEDLPTVPKHGPRLFTLAHETLRRRGVAEPEKCIVVLNVAQISVMLLKAEPFTAEELATIDRHALDYKFTALYLPHRSIPTFRVQGLDVETPNVFQHYVEAEDKQKFIDEYPYDIEPPTDNRPFFFELARPRNILEKSNFFNPLGGIEPHAVLMILIGFLALISSVFLWLPLRALRRRGVLESGTFPALLYFSALGLGFIWIEIPLSQQFILFLGRPVYALSVVLFSLLVSSGLGSLLAGRMRGNLKGKALLAIVCIVVLGFALTQFVGPLFQHFLHHALWVRILICVLFLLPLGVCMGIPFPLGIRILSGARPHSIPWAWGVNGYTSVLGSSLSILLGMTFGFRNVLWTAAATYLVGGLALQFLRARSGTPPSPEPDESEVPYQAMV